MELTLETIRLVMLVAVVLGLGIAAALDHEP